MVTDFLYRVFFWKRQRLESIRRWRIFRDITIRSTTHTAIKSAARSMPEVRDVWIYNGSTCEAGIETWNRRFYGEGKEPVDAMRKAALELYREWLKNQP